MKRLTSDTRLVVMDEEKALVLHCATHGDPPRLDLLKRYDIKELLADPNRRTLLYDHNPHETTRPKDHRRMGGGALADAVCAELAAQAEAGAFSALVIVAAPQVLGEMRGAMGDRLRTHVVAEIAKTLTGHALPSIAAIVTQSLSELTD
jgi:protein required for attachment to host cells